MKFLKFNLVYIVLPCSMLCSLHLLGLSFFFSVISSKEFVLNVIYVYVKSVSNVQHSAMLREIPEYLLIQFISFSMYI